MACAEVSSGCEMAAMLWLPDKLRLFILNNFVQQCRLLSSAFAQQSFKGRLDGLARQAQYGDLK